MTHSFCMPELVSLGELISSQTALVGLLSSFGYTEMMLLGIIALMLFGSRLPEVARNFGATYKQLRGKVDEFQREFRNWDQEVTTHKPTFTPDDEVERVEPKTPKFQPPTDDDE